MMVMEVMMVWMVAQKGGGMQVSTGYNSNILTISRATHTQTMHYSPHHESQ